MTKKKVADLGESHSNKLYVVLQCLDASQHKRLLRFLRSPYFIQTKTLDQLCALLLHQVERGKTGFDRKTVWQELFPGEPYDDVNFRKYCSDLLRLVGKFMGQELTEQNEIQQAINTLEFVVGQKIEPLYNGASREARATLGNPQYRSLEYFRSAYTIERHYYSMMDFDVRVNVRANIEQIAYNLDHFYWIEKLKLYSSALSQQRTGNQQYDMKFMDEIVGYLQKYPVDEVPELAIYYYSFLTLYEEENLTHYYNLKRLLDEYGAVMPREEATELIDSALHYCSGKINKGNRDFLQEYFDLFENALVKKVFLVNGELAPWRFNNIIATALRLGKLEWAENFVENFTNYLPVDKRRNTYTFNLARVYRYQGKFEKVLGLLRDVEYEDIGYNIISKTMLTITYYEMGQIEALDSYLSSFRAFLMRNKKIPYRSLHLNLIKYTRRLTRLSPLDKSAIQKLREEITREKATIVNHEWLLEKLAEME